MDQTAKLWDTRTGQAVATLRGHEDEVLDVAFDYTGLKLATASADGTACIYSVNATAQNCLTKLVGHKGEISKVIFNPQGSRVLTASIDKTARLWDSTSGECLQV